MKIITTKRALIETLKNIKPLLPKKTDKNLLTCQNILINVYSNSSTISLSLNDHSINNTTINNYFNFVSIEKSGFSIVNYYDLNKTIKNFKIDDQITLHSINKSLIVESNGLKFTITEKFDNDNDFYKHELKDKVFFATSINSIELLNALEKVAYAMAVQDVRYYLNGLLFEFSKTGFKLVATDGHRLAYTNVNDQNYLETIDIDNDNVFKFIVNNKTIPALINVLKHSSKDKLNRTQLIFSKYDVLFSNVSFEITSKLIDGLYPNYEMVLFDTKKTNHIKVDKKQFLILCKSAKSMSNEKYSGVKFSFNGSKISAWATNTNNDIFNSTIDCDNINNADFEIGFNVNYLIDALAPIKTDEITLFLRDQNSSICIDDQSIVMPMRL